MKRQSRSPGQATGRAKVGVFQGQGAASDSDHAGTERPANKRPKPNPATEPKQKASRNAVPTVQASDELRLIIHGPSKPGLPATPTQNRRPANYTFRFLALPEAARDLCYRLYLRLPTARALYSAYNAEVDEYYRKKAAGVKGLGLARLRPRLTTPAILLVCRQITTECRHALEDLELVLDRVPPWVPGSITPWSITHFVGRPILQKLRYIELRLGFGLGGGSGWVWRKIVKDLVEVLMERNSFCELNVVFLMYNRSNGGVWDEEHNHLKDVHGMLSRLEEENPNVWKRHSMRTEIWLVDDRVAREATTIGNEKRTLGEYIEYPNNKFWPGGFLEFA